jgi:hypothetical protein
VSGRKGGERVILLFQKVLMFLKKKVDNSYIHKGLIMLEELDLCDDARKENVLKLFSIYNRSKQYAVEMRSKRVKEELVEKIQNLLTASETNDKKSNGSSTSMEMDMNNPTSIVTKRIQAAPDLQQSRKNRRQLSTKKFKLTEPDEDSPLLTDISFTSRDSGISTCTSGSDSGISSISSSSQADSTKDSDEDVTPRLRRKMAFRRKNINVVPAPNSSNQREKRSESFSESQSIKEDELSVFEFDKRLMKDEQVEENQEIEKSIESSSQFIYPEEYHTRRQSMPSRLRSDAMAPDPSEVLGRDKLLSDSFVNYDELPALSEQDEIIFREVMKRRTIYSTNIEDSLGSNESSLCLEDHYLLTRAGEPTIISGRDGEEIIIMDDTDESDNESISNGEDEMEEITNEDHDIVQSSLRSYLSMAKINVPFDIDDQVHYTV